MKKILRRVVGVGVSKDELVCFGLIDDDLNHELISNQSFDDTTQCFRGLIDYAKAAFKSTSNTRYEMEATGVYYESLAYFLSSRNLDLSVVLATKIKHFAQTLRVKNVNDKTASQAIMIYGLSIKLEQWVQPAHVYRCLQQLTREQSQIIGMRREAKTCYMQKPIKLYPI